jgi:hypothetical protein
MGLVAQAIPIWLAGAGGQPPPAFRSVNSFKILASKVPGVYKQCWSEIAEEHHNKTKEETLVLRLGLLVVGVSLTCAAGPIVTDFGSSAAKPAGTDIAAGDGITHFISDTANVLGPFTGQSVHFEGHASGGSAETLLDVIERHLVFRYRLEFDRTVQLASLRIEGGAFNASQFRLLDESQAPIFSRKWNTSGNFFQSINLDVSGLSGKTFYFEEWDVSTFYRYRSFIAISAVPEPASLSIAAAGMAGLLLARRVRRR